MHKIAFAIKNLAASQLNFDLITNANAYINSKGDADITAMFETVSKNCLAPQFSIVNILEAWGYLGPVVATSLSTANKILHSPTITKRLFLCYDLEWMRFTEKSYSSLAHIYRNPELTLIARCKDHARIIEDVWGREPVVIESFDIARFIDATKN